MFISLNIVENIFANSLSAEHNNPITINAIIPVKHTALKILFFSFFSPHFVYSLLYMLAYMLSLSSPYK